MKRMVVYLLLSCLVFTTFTPGSALAENPVLSDIKGHWAEKQIERLVDSGYVKGYSDNTFKPNQSVTRAEFFCLLVQAQGTIPSAATTNSFSDTVNHPWARDYIEEAVRSGILLPAEYPNGLKPDRPILRSEVAAAIVRALGMSASSGSISFVDKDTVEQSDYRGFIKTAYHEGLMTGFETGEFKPFDPFTRAQACALLCLFLDKKDGQQVGTPPTNQSGVTIDPEKDTLTAVQVYDQAYSIGSNSLVFKTDTKEIKASTISLVNENIYLNYANRFALNSNLDNLEIIINNNRFGVSKLLVANKHLVVIPTYWKISTLNVDGRKYNPDFIDLYVGTERNEYLADVEVIDAYTLRIGHDTYDLRQEQLIVDVNDKFYLVKKVIIRTDADTYFELAETEPVVIKRPDITNISAIIARGSSLDLDNINNLFFIINGSKYYFNQCSIDGVGNFIVDQKTYSPDQVFMLIDGDCYQLNQVVKLPNSKIIIYCDVVDQTWVKIDDKYLDANGVLILMDDSVYDLDEVIVVARDLVRIKGRQYELDSTFKCRINNQTFNIDEIDYDTTMDITTIETSAYSSDFQQPVKYNFYLDNSIYQQGVEDVSIYVGDSWRKFNYIYIIDPAHYRYNNITYELIGSRIRIDGERFEVIDSAWRGAAQVFDLYLKAI
jgi:hypothetical protein